MKPNQHKKMSGFIQIPILIGIIILTISGIGGGYYATKQINKINLKQLVPLTITTTESNTETATNTEEVILNEIGSKKQEAQEITEQSNTKSNFALNDVTLQKKELSFQDKVKPVEQLVLETKNTPESNTEDYEKRFKDFYDEANALVQRLERDKNNLILLKDTVDDQRNKFIIHAKKLMDDWIKVAEESSLSVPSNYRTMLELTKESISIDSSYLESSINSFYDILDLYFIDTLREKDVLVVITEDQDRLRECMALDISEWINNKEYMSCEISLALTQGNDGSYMEDFIKITDKLVEVENIVFETIGTHTKRAENDIMGDLERIAGIEGIMQSIEVNMNRITSQSKYNLTQPTPSLQRVKCYTTTNSSIFDKNRTYNTTCEPYVQTIEEKCAIQKARSVSTSGVYIGGLVDPECQ